MTLYLFRLLSPQAQLYLVLTRGTYLANRWENEGGVNLYHCAGDGRGFFVEVGYDQSRQVAVVLRSFTEATPLEDYACRIRLPEDK